MALETLVNLLLDLLLSPTLWFSLGLALVYALLIFIWSGRGWQQLVRDVLASVLGFGLGHLVGVLSGSGWQLGQIQIFWGTLGALLALALERRPGGRLE